MRKKALLVLASVGVLVLGVLAIWRDRQVSLNPPDQKVEATRSESPAGGDRTPRASVANLRAKPSDSAADAERDPAPEAEEVLRRRWRRFGNGQATRLLSLQLELEGEGHVELAKTCADLAARFFSREFPNEPNGRRTMLEAETDLIDRAREQLGDEHLEKPFWQRLVTNHASAERNELPEEPDASAERAERTPSEREDVDNDRAQAAQDVPPLVAGHKDHPDTTYVDED